MPNPIYKLRRSIYKTEKECNSRAAKLNGKPVPDAARSLAERFPYLTSAEYAATLDAEDVSGDALLHVINKMALTPPPVAHVPVVAALDAPPAVQNSVGIVSTAVLACARALLAKPLLSVTEKQPRLLAMRAAPPNAPPLAVDSIEMLMEIASEICSLSRIQVFTSLLMHQHYSVVQLRAEIARVQQLAKAHPSVQFVVFIDEVNTAPALGVLNSVFVDSSLLGLSDNIFWVRGASFGFYVFLY